jgi:hypothetical protein
MKPPTYVIAIGCVLSVLRHLVNFLGIINLRGRNECCQSSANQHFGALLTKPG